MRRIISKRKINKSKSILAPRKHLYKGIVFLLFFSFAIVFIFGDHGLLKLYNIKNERKEIQKKISQLREEKEILKNEKSKIENDLDYIEKLLERNIKW